MDDYSTLSNRYPKLIGHEKMKKYGLTIPLLEKDGEDHIVFELRSGNLSLLPCEISLPGGAVEPFDKNITAGAVRETCEELGIKPEDIEIIAPMDILITHFEGILYPFLARIKPDAVFRPNKDEVEEIFTVPLKFFMDKQPKTFMAKMNFKLSEDFPRHLIAKDYKWIDGRYPIHFYLYKKRVIWGLTARIIYGCISVMKKELRL